MLENDSTPTVSKCLYSVACILVSGLKGWTYQSSKWYCLCGIHCQFARAQPRNFVWVFEGDWNGKFNIYILKNIIYSFTVLCILLFYIYIYINFINCIKFQSIMSIAWWLLFIIVDAHFWQKLGKWKENEIWMVKASY